MTCSARSTAPRRAAPRTPPTCDLSDSIDVDDEAVTFHLATPDPDLPFKLAMPFAFPVPAETPAEDQGLRLSRRRAPT